MENGSQISFNDKTVKAYLEGNLSNEETLEFEKLTKENPFYKDALEGLMVNKSSVKSLGKLKDRFNKNSLLNTSNLYSVFAIGFLIVGSICLFNYDNNNPKPILIVNENESSIFKDKNSYKIKEVKIQKEELIEEDLGQSIVKEKEKKAKSQKSVNDYKLTKRKEDSIAILDYLVFDQLVKIHQKPMLPIKEKINKELQTETVPLISIHGLINVNYTKIESGLIIKKQTYKLTGLPANSESSIKHNNEPSHEVIIQEVPYDVYLTDVQYDFSRNRFKNAIKGYKEILAQYPLDLNAHFYSGLCYYNINQYQKALEHFGIVETHQYDTFRQEGEWYTAQVLFDLGRVNEAKKILDKIISRDDFYATQAKAMRMEIK